MRIAPSNPHLLAIAALLLAGPALARNKPAAARQPAEVRKAALPPAPPRPVIDGDPSAWIPADAYPPEALQAGAEGRVGFLLNVDPTGRVSGCRITATSGTPVLDEATCQLVTANAHFRPPHDAAGRPMSSTFASAVRWVMPAPAAPPASQ